MPDKAPTPPPPPIGPRGGLIPSSPNTLGAGSAQLPLTDPVTGEPIRWMVSGVEYVPEPCGDWMTGDPSCAGQPGTYDVPENPTNIATDPFVIQTGVMCDTGQRDAQDQAARARRKLEHVTGAATEHEFWTGTQASESGFDTIYLAHPNVTILDDGDAVPLSYALAHIQRALMGNRMNEGGASCKAGVLGMVHMPPDVLSLLDSAHQVRSEIASPLLFDVFGNRLVAGAGYTGGRPRRNAVTTVTIEAGTGGTWSIAITDEFGNTWNVSGLAYNITAAALQDELDNDNRGGAGVTVTGGPGNTAPLVITWAGAQSSHRAISVAVGDSVTDGTVTATATTEGGSDVDDTGNTAWIYGTSQTRVYLSEPKLNPDLSDLSHLGTVLTEQNQIEVRAHRHALVEFDGCCHFAINADLANLCLEV